MYTSPIAINEAPAERIAELYAVGPSIANEIVQYRETHGFFTGPDDLVKVHGISQHLAMTLAPHIDWAIPAECETARSRDWTLASGWLLVAALMAGMWLPRMRTIQDILEERDTLGLTNLLFAGQVGLYGAPVVATLATILRGGHGIAITQRTTTLLRRASNGFLALAGSLFFASVSIAAFLTLRNGWYSADWQTRVWIALIIIGALVFFPQIPFLWRPSLADRRFFLYWMNCLLALLLAVGTFYSAAYHPPLGFAGRVVIAAVGTGLTVKSVWALGTRSYLLRPGVIWIRDTTGLHQTERRIHTGNTMHQNRSELGPTIIIGVFFSAFATAVTLATTGPRVWPLGLAILCAGFASYSVWAYVKTTRITTTSILTVITAIVALFGVAKLAGSQENSVPKFTAILGSIEPNNKPAQLLDFLDRNEGRIVYIDLDLEEGDDVRLERLFPSKPSASPVLTVFDCSSRSDDRKQIEDDCTTMTIAIENEPRVETHVHYITPALARIAGYFVVADTLTAMNSATIDLKPISVTDIMLEGRHIS